MHQVMSPISETTICMSFDMYAIAATATTALLMATLHIVSWRRQLYAQICVYKEIYLHEIRNFAQKPPNAAT